MDTTLSAELSAFRDFCSHEGNEILTRIIGANMEQDQLEDHTRIFQRSIEQLFLQWKDRLRSVNSESVETMLPPSPLPPTPPSTFIKT